MAASAGISPSVSSIVYQHIQPAKLPLQVQPGKKSVRLQSDCGSGIRGAENRLDLPRWHWCTSQAVTQPFARIVV